MTILSKLLALIVLGIITFIAASPLGAAVGPDNLGIFTLILIGVVALATLLAPTGRRAWGRGSLIAGAVWLALPLSMLVLSSQAYTEVVATAAPGTEGATSIGAGLGAGLAVGVAGFLGFFLGAIFLIIGLVLVLGGRREVVIVDRRSRA
jgi:hypothetical protein